LQKGVINPYGVYDAESVISPNGIYDAKSVVSLVYNMRNFALIVVFIIYSINCSIDGSNATLKAGRSRFLLPMGPLIYFFSTPNSFRSTMVLGFTQPVTEMSTKRFLGVKGDRRVRFTA
jgi:hypothetical protein